MGGRVGLKGTDGVLSKAIALGAKPVSPVRAEQTLKRFKELRADAGLGCRLEWLTCSGVMGEDVFKRVQVGGYEVVCSVGQETTAEDTKHACQEFLDRGVDLILFCGGDGTARDIHKVVGTKLPILGIPAGVKMHSGVFGVDPPSVAEVLHRFLENRIPVGDAEILDLDEEKYRGGEWEIRFYGTAKTPCEPAYIQSGKMVIEDATDEEAKEGIASHVAEEASKTPGMLLLLGPGSTIQAVANTLGVENSLLGIDGVVNGRTVGKDLNEEGLLGLLKRYNRVKLVLSPIGAQGFILGRGNLQLSPRVIRQIGLDNIIVVATPAKLARTPVLRVDTGDAKLDEEFRKLGHIPVVVGYRTIYMRPIK
ncbi:MAG: ATP-NAD kinase [Methanobacteriota archaeon]|nr:MAG: ATP-NAD kinase [Euryarchaeota archaeon]